MEPYIRNLTLFLKFGSESRIIAATFMVEIVDKGSFYPVLEDYSDETYPAGQDRVFLFDHFSGSPCVMVRVPHHISDSQVKSRLHFAPIRAIVSAYCMKYP
jgi:hypothetical protein